MTVEGSDDRELMTRFQERGDPAAFEALFHRHRTGLFRFLVRLSGNPTVAEEVSQQTWLQLIELAERRRYRPTASFRTALYSLARNRWVDDHLRRKEATRSLPLDDPRAAIDQLPAEDRDLGEALIQQQDAVAVSEALASLPSEQREVVALWMQGFELVDVARITGARWHTVVSRKRYALEKLRRTLAVHAGAVR